jgi:hypothetical protein
MSQFRQNATAPHFDISTAGRLPRVEDLDVVEVAANEAEAEIVCAVLRQAGIACMYRE